MTDTTAPAPHCPRCGHSKHMLFAYCPECHFNACESEGMGYVGYAPWVVAVRAELARRALEMRAHAHGSKTKDFDPVGLNVILPRVMKDYDLLGAHPLRLPGEGEA